MAGPSTRRVAAKKLSDYEMDFLVRFNLAPGCKRRRAGESMEDLLDRIKTDAIEILIMTEGSVAATAAVFDQPMSTIQTMIDVSDDLDDALEKGLQIARLREQESRDAALALKDFALKKFREEPRLVTHADNWPIDPELFYVELKEILPQALEDYGGSVIQMSMPLSVTISEIEAVIASDTYLQRKQMICMTKDDAAAEANFAEKAATGPAAGAYKFLSNRQPDKYADKQQIEFKNTGFQPPPAGEPKNALFNKKDEEES